MEGAKIKISHGFASQQQGGQSQQQRGQFFSRYIFQEPIEQILSISIIAQPIP
jgi:hypothetical protein